MSPAQLIGKPTVDAQDGVGPNGFANTDQGNIFKFHYLFSSMKEDLPEVEPFVPKPFDPESLKLHIPERHRPEPDDPDGEAKPSSKPRPKSPRPPKLKVVPKKSDDDDDDLPYRSK